MAEKRRTPEVYFIPDASQPPPSPEPKKRKTPPKPKPAPKPRTRPVIPKPPPKPPAPPAPPTALESAGGLQPAKVASDSDTLRRRVTKKTKPPEKLTEVTKSMLEIEEPEGPPESEEEREKREKEEQARRFALLKQGVKGIEEPSSAPPLPELPPSPSSAKATAPAAPAAPAAPDLSEYTPEQLEQLRRVVATAYHRPLWYYEHALKVQEFGTGALIPFALNPIQHILHKIAERQLAKEGHVRLIVLKARRFGVSTWVQGRFFHRAATRQNKNVMIVTHSRAATNTMFGMARVMEEHLPQALKPEVKYSGKNELVWGALGSEYGLATVGGREVRGSKTDFLHCSEVAFWGEAGEDYLTGLLNTVVQGYNTEVILESTANGVGGVFYNMYQAAESGDSGFESVFIPWYCYEHYQKPFSSEQEREDFEATLGKDARWGGEEERLLLGQESYFDLGMGEDAEGNDLNPTFTVTLEKLNWRRDCIKTQCQGDLDKFHQEYPSNPREAFVTTGRGVFDRDVLNEFYLASQRTMREDPPRLYRVPVKRRKEDGRNAYLLEPDTDATQASSSIAAELTVWRAPRHGREYRIGADVSEGIEIANRDTDYSVAVVLDAETYEECATLRTKIDPDLFAWQLTALGRWYNDALLTVESNNHGLVTLKFLQEFHNYPSLYFDRTLDERSNRATRKIGFKTSIKTKPVLIDYLKELIRERELKVHTPKVIDELQTFVYLPTGKTEAQPGSHDDCVMALALAALSCKLHPWTSVPNASETWYGGSEAGGGSTGRWGVYVPPTS